MNDCTNITFRSPANETTNKKNKIEINNYGNNFKSIRNYNKSKKNYSW